MKILSDPALSWLLGGTLALLVVASLIGWVLAKRASTDAARITVANLNARTQAWWGMVAIFAAALAVGQVGTAVMFGFCSFMALREFITLTPTKPADHRTLFWVFFIITPLHYYFLATEWYNIDVYKRQLHHGHRDQLVLRAEKDDRRRIIRTDVMRRCV